MTSELTHSEYKHLSNISYLYSVFWPPNSLVSITSSEHSPCDVSFLGITSLYYNIGKQFERQPVVRGHSHIFQLYVDMKLKERNNMRINSPELNSMSSPADPDSVYFWMMYCERDTVKTTYPRQRQPRGCLEIISNEDRENWECLA